MSDPVKTVRVVSPDGQAGTIEESELETAIASGFQVEGADESETVSVYSPSGDLGTVSRSELSTALNSGFILAGDKEDIAAAKLESEYGDQDIRATAEAFARGTTFGLSDYAMEAVGVPKEDLRGRQEANEVASTIGEITGVIAPALLTGGTSLLAKGAGYTAAGLAAKAGIGAAKLAKGAEATTALARVAQKAKQASAAAAVEGALYSGAKVVDDDWLNDHEITAERVVSGALLGAGTGLVTGGAIGGVGGVGGEIIASRRLSKELGRAMRADAEAAAAGQKLDQPRRSVDEVLDEVVEPDLAVDAMGPIGTPEVSGAMSSVKRLLAGADNAGGSLNDAIQDATKSIKDDVFELNKLYSEVEDVLSVGAKRELFSAYKVDGAVNDVEATSVMRTLGDSLDGFLDEMGGFLDGGGATIKKLGKLARETEEQVAEKLAQGDIGEAYVLMDRYKTALGRGHKVRDKTASEFVKDLYENTLRGFLEDESVWGAIATKQKPINKGISNKILNENNSFIRGLFADGAERAHDPFDVVSEANGKAIKAMLSAADDEAAEQTVTGFRKYLRSVAVDAKIRARELGDEAMGASAARIEELASSIESRIDDVIARKQSAEAWNRSTEFMPDVASRAVGKGVRAVSALRKKLSNRAEGARKAYAAAQASEKSLTDSADGLLANVARSGARATRVATAPSARGFLGIPKDPQKALDRIAEMRDPDSDARADLRLETIGIAADSPEMGSAIEAQVQRAADFLGEKAGARAPRQDGPFSHLRRPRKNPRESRRLARYADAVQHPQAALKRMRSGVVLREDVEALRAVYPRLYQRFAQRLITRAAEAKHRPSRASEHALKLALGGEPNLTSALMQQIAKSGIGAGAQDEQRQDTQQPTVTPGNAKFPEKMSESMMTRNDRLGSL